MPNENGQRLQDFLPQTIIRIVSFWILAVLAMYMCVADHPESTYIRQSVRCLLYFWLGTGVRCIDTFMSACLGGDRDNDGVRDRVFRINTIAMMSVAFGLATSFLGDIWCIQLVIARLHAFQEAFGESLPCIRVINCLVVLMKVCMPFVAFAARLPDPTTLVVSTFTTLCLLVLVALVCRAYLLPLKALRDSRKVDSKDEAMGKQLLKETQFAMRVIFVAQLGFVVAGFSMATFLLFFGLERVTRTNAVTSIYQYSGLADSLGNAFCIVLLSASSLSLPKFSPKKAAVAIEEENLVNTNCTCGQQLARTSCQASQPWKSAAANATCDACAWEIKVAELANRRVSVSNLLSFYSQLGSTRLMSHFDPEKSTTNDVVRHAVIPESRHGTMGEALAESWHGVEDKSRKYFPMQNVLTKDYAPRMVTHHWANRFRDLVAAVVADALHLSRWDSVAQHLSFGDVEMLRERLAESGSLDSQYWICALCINQHASICGNSMGVRDTVTGDVLPFCDCSTPKYFNDHPVECELNKFDSMMQHLHRRYAQGFLQVVAIDTDFNLFSRAWCVAELVEAHNSQMDQHVMLHSPTVLEEHSGQLSSLKVENCESSRPEDKEAILLKIGAEADIERFNGRLQQLLLGSKGLLAGWLDGQKLLQEVGAIAARARTRCLADAHNARGMELNQCQHDRNGDNSDDFAV
ncbi:unnamed protein product [Symbiodinium natans]|uniref:Uncharacterized protein n=1 Tax=Symbiodinium natans TaxID=878477 RepID=A0A812SP41_9DINO|nr:unnamed protein product [Symbiodinium natans]